MDKSSLLRDTDNVVRTKNADNGVISQRVLIGGRTGRRRTDARFVECSERATRNDNDALPTV